MNCRICNSTNLTTIFESETCPKSSHKYAKDKQEAENSLTNIKVLRCTNCNTVQLDTDFTEEYSEDYQRNTAFSKSALEFINRNINEYSDSLTNLKDKKIVEIGCGDGSFLKFLQDKGAKVTGFEPSGIAAGLAREKGLNILNTYFNKETIKDMDLFDGFVIRYVLEHIPNPNEFLKTIHSVCEDGAIGLIELPNYEKMNSEKRYFEFFREHVVYYSGDTLAQVLNNNGFELLKYYTVLNDEYLVAIVKRIDTAKRSKYFTNAFNTINKYLKKMIDDVTKNDEKVAFWGASGGGVSLINYANISPVKVDCIFDSDPNKWNRYTFGTAMKICEPTKEAISKINSIIILSPTYEKEISSALRDKFNFDGRIGSISGVPHWMD